jgi:hypothetical protein
MRLDERRRRDKGAPFFFLIVDDVAWLSDSGPVRESIPGA